MCVSGQTATLAVGGNIGYLSRFGSLGRVVGLPPLLLLLARGRRQIFDDLHKVQRENTHEGAHLAPGPVLPDVGLQLDHVPLGEGQLVAVLPLKVEACHAPRTAGGDETFKRSGRFLLKCSVQNPKIMEPVPDCCCWGLRLPSRKRSG